ncbi:MAG: hypothetical protein WC451_04620 [Patescibacteria group bacterium]
MRKNIFCIILLAVLSVALTGCPPKMGDIQKQKDETIAKSVLLFSAPLAMGPGGQWFWISHSDGYQSIHQGTVIYVLRDSKDGLWVQAVRADIIRFKPSDTPKMEQWGTPAEKVFGGENPKEIHRIILYGPFPENLQKPPASRS